MEESSLQSDGSRSVNEDNKMQLELRVQVLEQLLLKKEKELRTVKVSAPLVCLWLGLCLCLCMCS